jgi:hypothetical protein
MESRRLQHEESTRHIADMLPSADTAAMLFLGIARLWPSKIHAGKARAAKTISD